MQYWRLHSCKLGKNQAQSSKLMKKRNNKRKQMPNEVSIYFFNTGLRLIGWWKLERGKSYREKSS